MATTTVNTPGSRTGQEADAIWLRLVQVSVVLGVVAALTLGATILFGTTVDEGDFRSAGDYWLTASGLPFAVAGIGLGFGVHRLQHGSDGRLGAVGAWVNAVALTELFVQLVASLVVGSELRWGPLYVVCSFLTFLGTALLAAGSWRSGLLPRWQLGVWPVVWLLGSFAGIGPIPGLLAVFLVILGITVTRAVSARRGLSPERR